MPPEKIFDEFNSADNKLASRIEKVIFAAHNQMRSDPNSFVPILNNQIGNFENDKKLKRPGRPDLITQEGVTAWEEARDALKA